MHLKCSVATIIVESFIDNVGLFFFFCMCVFLTLLLSVLVEFGEYKRKTRSFTLISIAVCNHIHYIWGRT